MSIALTQMNRRNVNEKEFELRRGPWTFEEDNILVQYIAFHGQGHWNVLAKYSGLKRSGKSCRLRWLNYLKPEVKRGNLTIEEQLLILELHSQFGNRWSKIAQHLPGRTDNEIKNYWRTRVQKQARQLKVDSDSKRFVEAIRYIWMPRLIEQIDQKSSSSSLKTEIQVPSSFPSFQPCIKRDNADQCYNNSLSAPTSTSDELMSMNFEICDALVPNTQAAGSDWVIDDMASIWNMDELW